MAQYSFLNDTEINKIATQYGIGNVSEFKILSGGSENTNFVLKTESAKYVLTICEQKTIEEANQLVQLLEYLGQNNFATSKIIRSTNNALTILWNEKPVILKAFIYGHIIEDFSKDLLILLGKELAKLHQIEAPSYLPNNINYGISDFDDVELYAPQSDFYFYMQDVKKMVLKYLDLGGLEQSLIHGDVFYNNVVVNENYDGLTIMDLEEAGNYYRIFDIGMTIVGICKEGKTINVAKAKHLLNGYQQEIELTDSEKKALKGFTVYAAAAMSFWRHRNFNYTKPNPEMKDHYLALKVIADYVKDLPENCFFAEAN